jgi:hypothetical protein
MIWVHIHLKADPGTQIGTRIHLKAEGFFHVLEIVTGWLVASVTGKKIPVQPGYSTFHRRRSRLLKTGFLQAGKGAENTKEKNPGNALFI